MNSMHPLMSKSIPSRDLWRELQYIHMDDEDVRGRSSSSIDRNLDARRDALSDEQKAKSLEYVANLIGHEIKLSNAENTSQRGQDEKGHQANQKGETITEPQLRSQEDNLAISPVLGDEVVGGTSAGGYYDINRPKTPPGNRNPRSHVGPSRGPQPGRKQSSVVRRQQSQQQLHQLHQPDQQDQQEQQAPTAVPVAAVQAVPQQLLQQQHAPTGAQAATVQPGPQQPAVNQPQPVGPPQKQ